MNQRDLYYNKAVICAGFLMSDKQVWLLLVWFAVPKWIRYDLLQHSIKEKKKSLQLH